MTSAPRIELELDQVVCYRHGEPFRENWPRGFPSFSVKLLEIALKDDAMIQELGGDLGKVREACKRLPLCERVPPSVLLHLYHEVEIGKRARCVHCREIREGTPYNVTNRETGQIEQQGHLCFYCVVTAVEEHEGESNGHRPGG